VRRERRAMGMPRASQARYGVLLALLLFAVLAATPEILGALHLRNNALPKTVNGVRLLPAPRISGVAASTANSSRASSTP
jgi:hypothetical protein